MKRINYLSFKLKNLLSMTLKIIILLIGLNILLSTIYVIFKDNFQKETSYIYLKNITKSMKNLS